MFKIKRKKLQAIIDKANRLVHSNRVLQIKSDVYLVQGTTGLRKVLVKGNSVKCDCKGFRERGLCSHSLAVRTIVFKP